jgi:hypothetical protein
VPGRGGAGEDQRVIPLKGRRRLRPFPYGMAVAV